MIRNDLSAMVQLGDGYQSQRKRMAGFVRDYLLTGETYRLWGVWARHDWIQNPQLAPLAHGAVPYCETDIIWCAPDAASKNELAMFPHFLTPQQLAHNN